MQLAFLFRADRRSGRLDLLRDQKQSDRNQRFKILQPFRLGVGRAGCGKHGCQYSCAIGLEKGRSNRRNDLRRRAGSTLPCRASLRALATYSTAAGNDSRWLTGASLPQLHASYDDANRSLHGPAGHAAGAIGLSLFRDSGVDVFVVVRDRKNVSGLSHSRLLHPGLDVCCRSSRPQSLAGSRTGELPSILFHSFPASE